MRKTVLILNIYEYDLEDINKLKKKRSVLSFNPKSKKDLIQFIKKSSTNYKITELIVKLGIFYDESILAASNNTIKLIITPTTGLSHIDVNLFKKKNIKILSLKQKKILNTVTSTAEHAWALLLGLNKNLYKYYNDICNFKSWKRNECINFEIKNKTLGIIGYGRLGKMIARYAQVFGMKVLAYDKKKIRTKFVKQSNLKYIFKMSDFISINIKLNSTTNKIINSDILNLSKKTLILINTSRGEVIDQNYLFKLLEKNRIFAAGLDVLENDSSWNNNIPDNVFKLIKKNKDRLLITPHVGGFTHDAIKKTRRHIINEYIKLI